MSIPVNLRGTPEGLLRAWEEWDRQPSAKGKVLQYQAELKVAADRMGVNPNRTQELLAGRRRLGDTRREALENVLYSAKVEG